jgi:NAD(P)-dependent dehydrogenase (short-subunit alcohol dehydrogenase family)
MIDMSQFSLEGKVALVTGASRGIGKATALGYARAGADLIVVSRKLPDLEIVADEIVKLGRKALPVAAHIGRLDQIQNLVEKSTASFPKIDILVNNAGTSPSLTPILEAKESLWDVIINLNLKGLFFLSQVIAKIMKDHGGGKILNVASMDGFKPELNNSIYAISKAGVIMATKAMALEFAKYNIRVNCIAPGNVHTRLGDSRFLEAGYGPSYEKEMIDRTPLGRFAEPDEMVGCMIYLASDESSFVTGQTFSLDGGILLT